GSDAYPGIFLSSEFLHQFDVKESRWRIAAATRIDRGLHTAAANAAEIKRHRRPRAQRHIRAEVKKPTEVFFVIARTSDKTEGTLLKRAAAGIPQILRAAQAQMMRIETQAHFRMRLQPHLTEHVFV